MIGPVTSIAVGGGATAPLYLLRFDKDGVLQSPQTAAMMVNDAATATDVYFFAHGWNNVYADALDRYRNFAEGFVAQRARFNLPVPQPYRPILVGVIWPSTSLVLPWERGPQIAADVGDPEAERLAEEMQRFVTEDLDEAASAELSEITDGVDRLDPAGARRAAEILCGALWSGTEGEAGVPGPTPDAVLESWRAIDEAGTPFVPDDPDDFGGPGGAAGVGGPVAAGLDGLDPRNLVRVGTVWKMKARAGTVGATGVGPLLRALLGPGTTARVHLVGHSFGARVLLSALAVQGPSRAARSLLLLQPAVNRWCFAPMVEATGVPGGYAQVPSRVEQPILATFSDRDAPLHDFFHLAVRSASVGEPQIAAVGNTDLYGALGGYGPAGLSAFARTTPAVAAGTQRYNLSGDVRVIAIDGGVLIDGRPAIGGHGDISNPQTCWALHSLADPAE